MKSICDNCGQEYIANHINQRFCSNYGSGNCKDKYHNKMKKYTKYKKTRKRVASDKDYKIDKEYRKYGKCLYCNKRFLKKHVKQKFCSNHGRGNCKDRYHNSSSRREISDARLRYLGYDNRSQYEYDYIMGSEYDFENF